METNLEMKKKDSYRYNKWISHLNNTKDRTNYSVRRMDLLILAISGSGIYIIFETLREFKTGQINIENSSLLIWSGVIFLLCIISNFISQITGYQANTNEEKYIQEELCKMEGENYDECAQKDFDSKVINFNKWTNVLNTISITLMLIGLLLLAIFNYLLI
ncbi:hypothetical protein [Winogradskyella vincentii]|uniref:DUF4199 domain-containing protein n=1 Tax=Winogradskyella vincentii TaxID=2877122 RepID=A0ABS7Y3M9_9FLAO|nr:hypothetical protein [Winogradskyella vincentii]MCA0154539.1 hypothetical protein [Winogradskyella vincentii]